MAVLAVLRQTIRMQVAAKAAELAVVAADMIMVPDGLMIQMLAQVAAAAVFYLVLAGQDPPAVTTMKACQEEVLAHRVRGVSPPQDPVAEVAVGVLMVAAVGNSVELAGKL